MIKNGRNSSTIDRPFSLVCLEAQHIISGEELGCVIFGCCDHEQAILRQLHVIDGFSMFRNKVGFLSSPKINDCYQTSQMVIE